MLIPWLLKIAVVGLAMTGIVVLIMGTLWFTPRYVIRGPAARICGLILVLQAPLFFGVEQEPLFFGVELAFQWLCQMVMIGVAVFGVIVLIKGRLWISPTRVVRGFAVWMCGIILILQLPLGCGIELIFLVGWAVEHPHGGGRAPIWISLTGLPLLAFAAVLVGFIALVAAKTAEEKDKR